MPGPEERYWFPAKTYGWGWGPPATWQGWVVLVVWAPVLAGGVFLLRHQDPFPAVELAYVSGMSLVLVVICYIKGEPPRWRWGKDSE